MRIEAYQDELEEVSRDAWHRERLFAAVMLSPYSKKAVKPEEIVKFPWEKRPRIIFTEAEKAIFEKWGQPYKPKS